MRRISEELIEILRNDIPGPNSLSNTALLYMNRLTCETFKAVMAQQQSTTVNLYDLRPYPTQLFGITLMLYHGIPDGRWELVQRFSGENVTSGNVFGKESDALCGYRWDTYTQGVLRDHQCIFPAGHYPRLHCVCECGQALVVPPQ